MDVIITKHDGTNVTYENVSALSTDQCRGEVLLHKVGGVVTIILSDVARAVIAPERDAHDEMDNGDPRRI